MKKSLSVNAVIVDNINWQTKNDFVDSVVKMF